MSEFFPSTQTNQLSPLIANNNNNKQFNPNQHKLFGGQKKRYSCDQCSYSTDRRDLYRRHENIHRDEKPFRCYVCNKMFNRADHVKKHFLRIHKGLEYNVKLIKRITGVDYSTTTATTPTSLSPPIGINTTSTTPPTIENNINQNGGCNNNNYLSDGNIIPMDHHQNVINDNNQHLNGLNCLTNLTTKSNHRSLYNSFGSQTIFPKFKSVHSPTHHQRSLLTPLPKLQHNHHLNHNNNNLQQSSLRSLQLQLSPTSTQQQQQQQQQQHQQQLSNQRSLLTLVQEAKARAKSQKLSTTTTSTTKPTLSTITSNLLPESMEGHLQTSLPSQLQPLKPHRSLLNLVQQQASPSPPPPQSLSPSPSPPQQPPSSLMSSLSSLSSSSSPSTYNTNIDSDDDTTITTINNNNQIIIVICGKRNSNQKSIINSMLNHNGLKRPRNKYSTQSLTRSSSTSSLSTGTRKDRRKQSKPKRATFEPNEVELCLS